MQRFQRFKLARELVREALDAKKDGVIEEPEAVALVQDALALAHELVGDIKLSASAKELLKASAHEVLRLLEESPHA